VVGDFNGPSSGNTMAITRNPVGKFPLRTSKVKFFSLTLDARRRKRHSLRRAGLTNYGAVSE